MSELAGWTDLIDAAAVPANQSVYAEAEGLRLLIHHVGNDYFVTSSQCPHEDFTMDRCALRGHNIVCTEHGWRMDVRSGEVIDEPDFQLPTYPVRVTGGRVYAKLI